MPTYTTTTLLGYLLPASLPSSITTAMKDQWIADASGMVDAEVGEKYPILGSGQKFTDISDSTATPVIVELCSRWIAAYFGYVKIAEISRSAVDTQGDTYWKLATEKLAQIRKGELHIYSRTGGDLLSTSLAESTTRTRDATFTRGRYVDGVLSGDAGTLDDFTLE